MVAALVWSPGRESLTLRLHLCMRRLQFEAFVFGCVLVFDGEFCLRWLIASARPTRKKWVSACLESKLMAFECVDPLVQKQQDLPLAFAEVD